MTAKVLDTIKIHAVLAIQYLANNHNSNSQFSIKKYEMHIIYQK